MGRILAVRISADNVEVLRKHTNVRRDEALHAAGVLPVS